MTIVMNRKKQIQFSGGYPGGYSGKYDNDNWPKTSRGNVDRYVVESAQII